MYAVTANGMMTFPANDPDDQDGISRMLESLDLAVPYKAAQPAVRLNHHFALTLMGKLTKSSASKIVDALKVVFDRGYSIEITGREWKASDDAR